MEVFTKCLKKYGLKGLPLYLKLRYHKTNKVNVPGLKYPIQLRPFTKDRPTFEKIFLFDEYDFDFPSFINQPKVIVDAGANIGLSAIFFANKFPNAKIIALEPEPKNIEQFKLNTQNYPNIKLVEAALWKTSGWIEIVDKGLGEAGFMVKEVPEKSSKSIKSISLDKLIQEFDIQVIDFLKIDIEGSEKEVFENANLWLKNVKSFSVELHDHMKQACSKSVFKAVTQHNFQFDQKGENLLFFNLAYA